jgi:hypothetical protein
VPVQQLPSMRIAPSSFYLCLHPMIPSASAFVRYQLCTLQAEAGVRLSRLTSSLIKS